MGMSDRIEAFIIELMRQEQEDWLRIQRNELAQLFGCVPSQINYVISTRFGPDKGYIVESRRGGGGCVMIKRADPTDSMTEAQAEQYIKKLRDNGYITSREAARLKTAASDKVLGRDADAARARLMDEIVRKLKEVNKDEGSVFRII